MVSVVYSDATKYKEDEGENELFEMINQLCTELSELDAPKRHIIQRELIQSEPS